MTAHARPPWPTTATRLSVADLRIDLPNRRVERPDGVRQELPQRVFDLLLVFLAEPHAVHSRDALFERVWQGVIVEDANLTQGVWMLRKAFGEERRQWFRTVSKTGYIFEPPGTIEVVDDAPAIGAGAVVPVAETAAAPVIEDQNTHPANEDAHIPPAPSPARRFVLPPMLPTAFAAAIALLALVLPVLPRHAPASAHPALARAADATTQAAPLRIHLSSEASSNDPDAQARQWPARLLEAWLTYKFELLPETILMSPGAPLAAAPTADERRIMIWSTPDVAQPGIVVMRARIVGAAGSIDETLEARGTADDAIDMADGLSQRILARLLPAHAHLDWPALPADVDATRHFVEATVATRQRDWATAEREADAAGRIAPAFGPARWLQARIHTRRGKADDALRHLAEAMRTTAPLPEDAARVFEAQTLAMDPSRREDAIARYSALSETHPLRRDYSIARGFLLLRVGRPREALQAAKPLPRDAQSLPIDQRIRQALVAAEATLASGDPANARRLAQSALALIANAGPGFEREQGAVRMLFAHAHHADAGNPRMPELYDLAAQAYLGAGDTVNGGYARFHADNMRLEQQAIPSSEVEPLIAIARSTGNVSLEIEVLRITAYRFYRNGHHALFREYIERAQDTAQRTGDLAAQRIIDFDLMGEDFFRAKFASARVRVKRLRAGAMEGPIGYLVPQLDGTLLYHQGRYRSALDALRDGERTSEGLAARDAPTVVAPNYACTRADILLAMRDTETARGQIQDCRQRGAPSLKVGARIMEAWADIIDGDRDSARVRLQGIEQAIEGIPAGLERWAVVPSAGALIASLGDYARAEQMLLWASDAMKDTGYDLLTADAEIGLAEISAARGDWARAREYAARARQRVPQDGWLFTSRLDKLDIVDALAHGDTAAARARVDALQARASRNDDRGLIRDLARLSLATHVAADGPGRTLDPVQGYIDWMYGRDLGKATEVMTAAR